MVFFSAYELVFKTNVLLLYQINVAYASDVFVMSFTHTGEPGYCLYVPSEYALHVYGRLMAVGLLTEEGNKGELVKFG
jgi:glycine cleavage system aminomethyltransferase T